MAKSDKELEQISTTDKVKAFKTLKDAGLRVELNGSGVPTVICANVEDMDKTLKNVKKMLKELRYVGSFGVRGPRKTDNINSDDILSEAETTENMEIAESQNETEAMTA